MASSNSAFDPEQAISHKFPETSFSYSERDVAIYALGVGACGKDAVDEKELQFIYHRDGQKFIKTSFSYNERDVAIYALGVGACGKDAVDEKELQFVYHRDGHKFIKVLPTFAALFPFQNTSGLGLTDIPGLEFDPRLLLHGQQYIEIYKPFPSSGSIQNKVAIAGLHDKGKATIIELEITSYVKESGEALCMNRSTVYLRGAGGFSKSSKPFSYANYVTDQSHITIPKQKPSLVYEDCTQQSQALLYRLSGDYNPLHSDPTIAQVAGFTRPILHGLCTLGFAVRAIIKSCCNGEPAAVKSIFGRFLLHVYPGETIITEMWLEGQKVIYQTKVKERNRAVLSGYVILKHIPASLYHYMYKITELAEKIELTPGSLSRGTYKLFQTQAQYGE